MARFYGNVGFSEMVETSPGSWSEVLVKKPYYGDLLRDARRYQGVEKINEDVTLNVIVSVLIDPYALANLQNIRTVEVLDRDWKVSSFDIQYPRVILTLGGVYNG